MAGSSDWARRSLRVLAAGVFVLTAYAQREEVPPSSPTPPPAAKPQSDEPRWTLHDDQIELTVLADLAARGLGVHLEYDRTKLAGSITLDRPGNYSPRELWDVVNRELATRGLASVQPPGVAGFKVVPIADAAGLARVEASDLSGALAGYVKLVVTLDHKKPEDRERCTKPAWTS